MRFLGIFKMWARALRINQWPKNALIGVPLVSGHLLFDFVRLKMALILFLAFSLLASGNYLINDLLDRHDDQSHPHKKSRPVATGCIPKWAVIFVSLLCMAMGLGLGSLLSFSTVIILLAYLVMAIVYSMIIKKMILWDVGWLSGLYTIRVMAGHVGLDVPYSGWLLGFAAFFFFGLAILKRCVDISAVTIRMSRRGYFPADIGMLSHFGIASGYMSVLVMALYITSDAVKILYTYPAFLWLLCPCIMWWISRLWFRFHRDQLTIDPLQFALRDPPTYAMILYLITIIWVAT